MSVMLVAMLTGCASMQTKGPDRTGGLTLSLSMHDEEGGAGAVYKVDRHGTIGFGGGFDAAFDRVSWNGIMTDEEIAQLRELIEQHAWLDRAPKGSGEPKGLRYRVNFSSPNGGRRFTVSGECESVQAVESLLDGISRRRFEPILEKLPKASVEEESPGMPPDDENP